VEKKGSRELGGGRGGIILLGEWSSRERKGRRSGSNRMQCLSMKKKGKGSKEKVQLN